MKASRPLLALTMPCAARPGFTDAVKPGLTFISMFTLRDEVRSFVNCQRGV